MPCATRYPVWNWAVLCPCGRPRHGAAPGHIPRRGGRRKRKGVLEMDHFIRPPDWPPFGQTGKVNKPDSPGAAVLALWHRLRDLTWFW